RIDVSTPESAAAAQADFFESQFKGGKRRGLANLCGSELIDRCPDAYLVLLRRSTAEIESRRAEVFVCRIRTRGALVTKIGNDIHCRTSALSSSFLTRIWKGWLFTIPRTMDENRLSLRAASRAMARTAGMS